MKRLALFFPLLLGAAPPAHHVSPEPAPMLVTTTWLAAHLHDRNLVLVHEGMGEYAQQHIPGARELDLSYASPSGLALEMPPPESLRVRLEEFGISDDSRIIVYFGSDMVQSATRAYFTLYYAGLGGSTSVLDGGIGAWVRDGHPTTTEVPSVQRGHLSPLHTRPFVVDAEWVRAHAQTPGVDIVDARSAGFYDGVMEGGPRDARRRGHIPGARSVPFDRVVDDSNVFKSADQLADLFRAAGVKAGDTIVGYCHIGEQATAMLFAASAIGFPVRLYDGSFQDWARRNWPVETVAAKAP
jgi:thiosulfate/3-mercaptopyruvate sulfurtransferase